MSHHHVAHLDTAPPAGLVADAVGRLLGIVPDGPGTAVVRRPGWARALPHRDDDPGWHEIAVAAPDGGRLRSRRTSAQFDYITGTSPFADDPDEPDEGRPLLRCFGIDAVGMAVVTAVAELVGGHVVANDDWRPDHVVAVPVARPDLPLPARVAGLVPVTAAQVRTAARTIHGLDRPGSPHRVHVPALARADVPYYQQPA